MQLLQPLFEFSGACAGCGETPYIKLLTQLFGDRAVIANATGCSSIYGGNLPTTPYTNNKDGRGIAWSNSLFEDNAEFGLGIRLSIDKQRDYARELLVRLAAQLPEELVKAMLDADPERRSRHRRAARPRRGAQAEAGKHRSPEARALLDVADMLVEKSVWIVGGDGWAYDIGYGGLDHVMASGRNVNILVLDTEVYSNTGGQMSKATPRGAVAKFAAGGKPRPKKDLALIAMSYAGLCRPRRHGRQRHADAQGIQRSRGLRRPVADPRLQPLHRPRLRHACTDSNSRSWPYRADTGRCSATIPDSLRRAIQPSSWIAGRPAFRWKSTFITRPATPCFARAIRRRPRSCSAPLSKMSRRAGSLRSAGSESAAVAPPNLPATAAKGEQQ